MKILLFPLIVFLSSVGIQGQNQQIEFEESDKEVYLTVEDFEYGVIYTGVGSQYANWNLTYYTILANIENGLLPENTLERGYDTYIAVYHCYYVGQEFLVKLHNTSEWLTAIAVDCSNQIAYPEEANLFSSQGENWLLEFDANIAAELGITGQGTIVDLQMVSIYE